MVLDYVEKDCAGRGILEDLNKNDFTSCISESNITALTAGFVRRNLLSNQVKFNFTAKVNVSDEQCHAEAKSHRLYVWETEF